VLVPGLLLCSFATDLWHLCLAWGVVSRLGWGRARMAAITIIPLHFDKHMAFATGLAISGSGIGTLAFAPLFDALLTNVGWKETFRVQAT